MKRNLSLIAWIMVALALLAWIGVGLFVAMIGSLESHRISQLQSAQSQLSQVSDAAFTHAFITNDATQRAQLDSLSHVDPSQFAQFITGSGTTAGVAVSITSASQGPTVPIDAGISMNSYTFLASGHGSFSSLMQAAGLLQTMPAPSFLQQIEFTREPSTAGNASAPNQWVMSAQIQFYSESST